jgi:hypothetical protein
VTDVRAVYWNNNQTYAAIVAKSQIFLVTKNLEVVNQQKESAKIKTGCFDGDNNGPQAAFRALMVAGVPIYPDPYCPEGTVYFLNTNYLSLYIHEQGSFVFTGFESTLPNWQIGYVGAVLMIAELVNVKPKSMTVVSGYNYLSL